MPLCQTCLSKDSFLLPLQAEQTICVPLVLWCLHKTIWALHTFVHHCCCSHHIGVWLCHFVVSWPGVQQRCTQDYDIILVELFLHAMWLLDGLIACIFPFKGLYACFLRLVERVCYCPQGQQQCLYNSTVPTPSTFSGFLDIHCVLLCLECGPDVCCVLGLTWVM